MLIIKKRINAIPKGIKPNTAYYVSASADEKSLSKLNLKSFEEGLLIQPSVECGPMSRKNVYGYSVPNKELPKEDRFIRTIYWEWQLWNGEWESEFCDIYRKCYPRIEFEPYNIEMKSRIIDGNPMFITRVDKYKDIMNVINLYLEVFGYCTVLNEELELANDKFKYRRCNWEILPPDARIQISKKMIQSHVEGRKYRKDYNQERLDVLETYNPVEKAVGYNSFQGYYAYVYENICVFENPIYGNATYVVPTENWEKLSKMTKKELISSGQLLGRLEHNKNWFNSIKEYMM